MSVERPRFRRDLMPAIHEVDGIRVVDVTDPRRHTSFRFFDYEYSVALAFDGRPLAKVIPWVRITAGLDLTIEQLTAFAQELEALGFLEMEAVTPPPQAHKAIAYLPIPEYVDVPIGEPTPAPLSVEVAPPEPSPEPRMTPPAPLPTARKTAPLPAQRLTPSFAMPVADRPVVDRAMTAKPRSKVETLRPGLFWSGQREPKRDQPASEEPPPLMTSPPVQGQRSAPTLRQFGQGEKHLATMTTAVGFAPHEPDLSSDASAVSSQSLTASEESFTSSLEDWVAKFPAPPEPAPTEVPTEVAADAIVPAAPEETTAPAESDAWAAPAPEEAAAQAITEETATPAETVSDETTAPDATSSSEAVTTSEAVPVAEEPLPDFLACEPAPAVPAIDEPVSAPEPAPAFDEGFTPEPATPAECVESGSHEPVIEPVSPACEEGFTPQPTEPLIRETLAPPADPAAISASVERVVAPQSALPVEERSGDLDFEENAATAESAPAEQVNDVEVRTTSVTPPSFGDIHTSDDVEDAPSAVTLAPADEGTPGAVATALPVEDRFASLDFEESGPILLSEGHAEAARGETEGAPSFQAANESTPAVSQPDFDHDPAAAPPPPSAVELPSSPFETPESDAEAPAATTAEGAEVADEWSVHTAPTVVGGDFLDPALAKPASDAESTAAGPASALAPEPDPETTPVPVVGEVAVSDDGSLGGIEGASTEAAEAVPPDPDDSTSIEAANSTEDSPDGDTPIDDGIGARFAPPESNVVESVAAAPSASRESIVGVGPDTEAAPDAAPAGFDDVLEPSEPVMPVETREEPALAMMETEPRAQTDIVEIREAEATVPETVIAETVVADIVADSADEPSASTAECAAETPSPSLPAETDAVAEASAFAESTEVVAEASAFAESTEIAAEAQAFAESTDVTAEASAESTEVAAEASAESTEVAAEASASAESTEVAAEASADVAESRGPEDTLPQSMAEFEPASTATSTEDQVEPAVEATETTASAETPLTAAPEEVAHSPALAELTAGESTYTLPFGRPAASVPSAYERPTPTRQAVVEGEADVLPSVEPTPTEAPITASPSHAAPAPHEVQQIRSKELLAFLEGAAQEQLPPTPVVADPAAVLDVRRSARRPVYRPTPTPLRAPLHTPGVALRVPAGRRWASLGYALLGVMCAVALGVLGLPWVFAGRPPEGIKVRTFVPEAGTVYRWFEATAPLQRAELQTLDFPVSGKVTRVVEPGTVVAAGDVLATVEASRSLQAELLRQQERLNFYRQQADKARAAGDVESARQAEAALEERGGFVRQTMAAIARVAVVAQGPGRIEDVPAVVGQTVQAGAPAVRVRSTGWRARFELPRAQAAQARHVGFCRLEVEGKLFDCVLEADPTDDLHVQAEVDGIDPGLTGKPARLARLRYESVFVLPSSAVSRVGSSDRVWVVLPNNRVESRAVLVAEQNANGTIVLQGLDAGEALIIDPPAGLSTASVIQPTRISPR
jgi:multidrug efflux pump subunit AcrA (membrane-fusion protein)